MSGARESVLKWKPQSMNSVNFKLRVAVEGGAGIVTQSVGLLFVGGLDVPFDQIKMNKQLKDLNGKIVECKYEDNKWVFMRERIDKSFPNGHRTALGKCLATSPSSMQSKSEKLPLLTFVEFVLNLQPCVTVSSIR